MDVQAGANAPTTNRDHKYIRLTVIGLTAVAGASLLGASLIHFGLTEPILPDRFPEAAMPEALLSASLLGAGMALKRRRPGAQALGQAAVILATLLTLYGLSTTLSSGRIGDIAYHLTLLGMLFAAVGLVLSRNRFIHRHSGAPSETSTR